MTLDFVPGHQMMWNYGDVFSLKITSPMVYKMGFFQGICCSPIAISLGSYMDKAAGRRPCTGKKFTQDVSVLSR